MKARIVLFTIIIGAFLSGCSNTSIEDAYREASDNQIVVNGEETQEMTKTYIKNDPEKDKIDPVKEINIGKYGEWVKYYNFSLEVESVLLTDNVYKLNQIVDEDRSKMFADYLVNDQFGPNSSFGQKNINFLDEDGNVTGELVTQILFLRVKMKNETDRSLEECLNPTFYNMYEEGKFSYLQRIDVIGYDMIKNSDDKTESLYYTFKPNEEIDTVLAFMVYTNLAQLKNVYVSSVFMDKGASTDPRDIPKGCWMIPLNIIGGKVVEN